MTTVSVTPTSRTVVQIDRNIVGPQGPTGDVNPEMYVILAAAELAQAEAETAANSAQASATTATNEAVISTNAADQAAGQAVISTTQAGLASTSASSASASANTATTQAGISTTQAGISTTQAGIATTQAGAALGSSNNAATSASTATTQAGISTTQAGISTTQAGISTTQAGLAAGSASAAATSASQAATSATTAVNAPGTSGTSTTSLAIGLGSKTFTTQTGKSWGIGQFVVVANTSAVDSFMFGQISAYNSATGSMTVLVTAVGLLGTYATWTISLAPAVVSTAVDQSDVGTAPNQIPLNQYLGTMVYQDFAAVNLTGGAASNIVLTQPLNVTPTITAIVAAGSTTTTVAQLLTQIITVTQSAAVTLVLPTGTLTDAGLLTGLSPVGASFEWSIINLGSASGAVSMSAGAAHTIVGSLTIPISTSARFRSVKTATNTYVSYRIT